MGETPFDHFERIVTNFYLSLTKSFKVSKDVRMVLGFNNFHSTNIVTTQKAPILNIRFCRKMYRF